MESPAVKDLPKLDSQLSTELTKDHKLKHAEMTEKIVLPTAEDVKAEKTHQGLIQGVESFTPDKLKPAKTREPASGSDVMKTEMAHNASLEGVKQFDQNNLKQVETQEKNPLPDPEAIRLEAEHKKSKKKNLKKHEKKKDKFSLELKKNLSLKNQV